MASLKMAGGSVLSTVTDTANAISGVMNTLNGGVQILNDKVQVIRARQVIDNKIDLHNYKLRQVQNSALENVRLEETVRNYIGNDVTKQNSFNKFEEELNKLLNAKDEE